MIRRYRLALAVVPALLALAGWGWWAGVRAARETRVELSALKARQQQLEDANRNLRREVDQLQRERWARERAAREALPVAAPGEVLVVIPSPSPAGSEPGGENGP